MLLIVKCQLGRSRSVVETRIRVQSYLLGNSIREVKDSQCSELPDHNAKFLSTAGGVIRYNNQQKERDILLAAGKPVLPAPLQPRRRHMDRQGF